MANIKSAEKRNRQNIKRRELNRVWRGGSRTAVKKARLAIEGGAEDAAESLRVAVRALDKAANKGIIHKNNASRRKSRLMLALNKITA
ncbi:MAG: 30S ribosomal protein S20 [Chloroflexi bacterium]|nr:30S ribosomal protein S20 [Chloroflexota bacterium]